MSEVVMDQAIVRAQEAFFRSQRADGSWSGPCDQGPVATAQVVVGLRFLDALGEGEADGVVRWLLRQQRSDGSFVGHPFALCGDLSATATAWAALIAAGLAPEHEAVRRAKSYVDANGGVAALAQRMEQGDLAALFVVMAKLAPADALVAPPFLFTLIPPLERFVERRFSVQMPFVLLLTGVLLHALRGDWGTNGADKGLAGWLESRRCLEMLASFQNDDGSWLFGDTMHGVLALAAMRGIGVPADDARASRGLAWLRAQRHESSDGAWYSIFESDVWTTAFAARALLASGIAGEHPTLARAAAWLLSAQRAKDGAAWGFQAANTTMPDCDDTGVVLGPVGMLAQASSGDAIARATSWLFAMQNADGGWPSFQHGLPGKRPGPMMSGPLPTPGSSPWDKLRFFLNPPPALGDPSTEDVTGRVLFGLGKNGHTARETHVARAIEFLRVQQCPSGAWWGRWVVNYLAGTAWALRGLAAVHADARAPWIRNAVAFVTAHQNPDGGWGEDVASYRDESLAGVGASTPGLTGLVISALVEIGESRDAGHVRAGVDYLVRTQREDGTWPNETLLHALVPPELFYVLPGAPEQLALEALGLMRASH